jgi:hypothetical protein
MSPLAIFIAQPWLAAVVGLVFGILGWQRRWGVVAVGVLWALYAVYETGMQQRWFCSGECNIRVDLLLIYPALLLFSAGAVLSLHRAGWVKRKPRTE